MTLLILYLLIALLFSFLCSVMEAVILSATPSFITKKEHEGKSYAKQLRHYKENIDKPLAAILTLNTFAHTIGAAGVGAQAQIIWGNEYLSLTSVLLTIMILVFSEIIPKTLGANYWTVLTEPTVFLLQGLMIILYPFVILTQCISKLFNIHKRKSVLSRADFSAMATIAVREGVFQKGESRIIQNIARFDKILARDIITPRVVVFAAQENIPAGEFYRSNPEIRFSRIPIYKESIDNISGYILKDELLIKIIEKKQNSPLQSFARQILVVYDGMPISKIYNNLISNNEHIALVVDEYGGTSGIVTLEDIIETILGLEIVDETDNIEDLREVAKNRWKERAAKMGIKV